MRISDWSSDVCSSDLIVQATLDVTGYSLRTANIEVRLELDPAPPPVWGDSDQLNQVVTNIIVNAQQAMMDVTTPRVLTIRSAYDDAAKEVTLTIADSGPGIPEEIQSRIFEHFLDRKRTRLTSSPYSTSHMQSSVL